MGIQAFSPNEFEQLLTKGYRSIDLREPDVFALSFIPSSLNLILDDSFEKNAKKFLFKDEALLVVAEEGCEEDCIFEMEKLGYLNVRGYLKGGIESWINTQKPIDVVISILPDELVIEMKFGNLYVYDIRSKTEFDKGHLETSEHLKPELMIADYSVIEDNEYSALVCGDGRLSMSLASYLKKNGKYNLYHAQGGFREIRKYPEISLVKSKKE